MPAYLVATKDLGILFDGSKGPELKAFSDSDWLTVHSTTCIVLVIAGAPVSYASKRQQGCRPYTTSLTSSPIRLTIAPS